MWEFVKTYLVTFVVFLIFEMLWLGVIAKKLYEKELGYIMSPKVNLIATLVFFAIFIFGFTFFVINPSVEKSSWTYALTAGMLLGIVTYATYTLTNLATLQGWPLKIAFIDILWGATLGGAGSVGTFFVLKLLRRF